MNVADHQSHAPFLTTSWTMIRRLQNGADVERREIYEAWIRAYWKPIYAYFRAKGKSTHEAEDLVQGFLQAFIDGDRIMGVEQTQSRFRNWLMTCARNYLIGQHRKATAAKRQQPGRRTVSIEELCSDRGDAFQPLLNDSPEQAYSSAWRRDLIATALRSVETEAELLGRTTDVQIFLTYYNDATEARPTWEEIARQFGLSDWKEASRKSDWVKRRLGQSIRNEIRKYVDSAAEIEEEIRDLLK